MRDDFGVPKSHSPTCSLSFSHASHQDLGPLFLFCKFCFLIKKNLSTLYSELSWYYLSSIPPIWCLRHHLVPYLETSTLLPGTSQFVSLCTFFSSAHSPSATAKEPDVPCLLLCQLTITLTFLPLALHAHFAAHDWQNALDLLLILTIISRNHFDCL